MCVWNHESGQVDETFSVGGLIGSMRYTEGHLFLGVIKLSDNGHSKVDLVLIKLGSQEVQHFPAHNDIITEILVIKKYIFTAGFDGVINIWEFNEGGFKVLQALPMSDD